MQETDRGAPFLLHPTGSDLQEAVAENHWEWMVLKARAGGEVHQTGGVTWTYAGPQGEAMILFPHLEEDRADEVLDTITRFYCERQPEPLVGCWSLDPPRTAHLEERLLARGFQLGWQPHWMCLDFRQVQTGHARPEGLEVRRIEERADWDVEDLPYYGRDGATLLQAAKDLEPRRVWHFGAFLQGRPVGQAVLCVTSGPRGVAGLYDVGVVPGARKQGVGKAVTLAACRFAQELGCGFALLNATGERMYRQLGFTSIGYGRTWWLNARRPNPRLLQEGSQ